MISYEELSQAYFSGRNKPSNKFSVDSEFDKIEALIRKFEACVRSDAYDEPDSSKSSLEQSRWHIFHAIVCGLGGRNGEQWSTTPPTEAGWYRTRGRLRVCIEALEIGGLIWPPLPHIDWDAFKGCEFSRIIWPDESTPALAKRLGI